MERIGRDLGCIRTVNDPVLALSEGKWKYGIVFMKGESCFSAMGKFPGYTGGFVDNIEELEMPPGWQVISMGAGI